METPFARKLKKIPESYYNRIFMINIEDICPNKFQPRIRFDSNSIIRLADSIRKYGVLQPLSIRRSEEGALFKYELIAGERRLRAARLAGLYSVPCVIVEADDMLSSELAIIENLLREDLDMFEQAISFEKLIKNHNMTQEEIARKISMSQSAVANKLRLLKLSEEERSIILDNSLTERHARAMLRLPSKEKRLFCLRTAVSEQLNVKETEELVEKLLDKKAVHKKEEASALTKPFVAPADSFIKYSKKKISSYLSEGRSASMSVSEEGNDYIITVRIAK